MLPTTGPTKTEVKERRPWRHGVSPWRQPSLQSFPGNSLSWQNCSEHPFTYVYVQFSSLPQLCLTLPDPMDYSMPGLPIHHQLPYSNSYPLNRWCHPTNSSSVIPFSSCLQSFPALGSFQMSQFFASGGQSIAASASVLPMNIQDWFLLGWTGWIYLQSKGLSRVFSNTLQKHHFVNTQLSL